MLKILCLFFCIFLEAVTLATPHRVIILRHAENGDSKFVLSPKGEVRALALAKYFKGLPSITFHLPPDAIFAAEIHTLETISPTAQAFNMFIGDYFTLNVEQIPEFNVQLSNLLLGSPLYDNKVIIICWEHNNIPPLAHLLGATQAPNKWPGKDFDHFWIITYNPDGSVASFEDICQPIFDGSCKFPINKLGKLSEASTKVIEKYC